MEIRNFSQNYNQQRPAYVNPFRPPSRSDRGREFAETTVSGLIQLFGARTAASTAGATAATTGAAAAGQAAARGGAAAASGAASVAAGATIVGGLYGAYNLLSNWGRSTPAQGAASGAAVGAAIGSIVPGVGTLVGAGVGLVVGGLIGCIRTGKHPDQMLRDAMRDKMQEIGVINDDYQFQLADGSTFDMGKDGGAKLENGCRYYEVDFTNQLAPQTVSLLNPILELVTGGHPKLKSDFVGYFTNAILSRANSIEEVRAHVDHVMQSFGLSNEALAQGTIEMAEAGKVDRQTAMVYLAGIQEREDQSRALAEAAGLPR